MLRCAGVEDEIERFEYRQVRCVTADCAIEPEKEIADG
jgi:hypothetical protein